MYLNQFSVRVEGGIEVAGGYVELTHGKNYSLRLRNDHGVQCDAEVEIDGKVIGIFRLLAHSSMRLERTPDDDGKFTFYELGSREGEQVGLDSANPDLGLVKVTFTPEKKRIPSNPIPRMREGSYFKGDSWEGAVSIGAANRVNASLDNGHSFQAFSARASNYSDLPAGQEISEGGTGLSGHSGQTFINVGTIEHDLSQQTVISLRLVGIQRQGKEEPRPLVSHANPVPPRVGR